MLDRVLWSVVKEIGLLDFFARTSRPREQTCEAILDNPLHHVNSQILVDHDDWI
jgi:hypothetical protein